jgi:hypothetical protein
MPKERGRPASIALVNARAEIQELTREIRGLSHTVEITKAERDSYLAQRDVLLKVLERSFNG